MPALQVVTRSLHTSCLLTTTLSVPTVGIEISHAIAFDSALRMLRGVSKCRAPVRAREGIWAERTMMDLQILHKGCDAVWQSDSEQCI